MYNFLYSLISFIVAFFFISLGIASLFIPWSASLRTGLIDFILEDSLAISLFGFATIIIGLAIMIYIILNSKKKHYYIKSSESLVQVDETAIQQYLTHYCWQLFPKQDIPCRVQLKKNKIHIAMELPYMPISEQRGLLERIRQDVRKLLASYLGYQEDFYLTASFQGAPKKG